MDSEPSGYITVPGIDVPYYFSHILSFFTGHGPGFYNGLKSFIGVIVGLSIPLSVFLFLAIIIVTESLKTIRKKEEIKFGGDTEPAFADPKVAEQINGEKKEEAPKTNPVIAKRWKAIIEHADGPNQNDWKQAIIDADVLLEQLVTDLGYQGASLGEQLKRTTTGDFKTRDAAWEAHLIRNRIAHDGAAYDINQVEAKRVISLYRQVFDEFYDISG